MSEGGKGAKISLPSEIGERQRALIAARMATIGSGGDHTSEKAKGEISTFAPKPPTIERMAGASATESELRKFAKVSSLQSETGRAGVWGV